MAASTRLPSIWMTVCRSSEMLNPALRRARAAQRIRLYHPNRHFQQEHISQRYGTANEPPPHLGGGKSLGPSTKKGKKSSAAETKDEPKALPKIGEKLQRDGEKEAQADGHVVSSEGKKKEPTTVDGQSPPLPEPSPDNHDTIAASRLTTASVPDGKPLQTILDSVPDPQKHSESQPKTDNKSQTEEHPDQTFDEHSPPMKAPHMEPPRYMHHFDTYGLVKRLKEGGWDEKQAITVMKAMRVILGDQQDLAKEALVSKSQLENEAYLFKAACAELKTEVTTRRKSEQEKMRTERAQLQHEVDIISQRLGQESTNMKEELKGLFDDRKMAVRNEQRDMESKIQQLGYQITVNLQSDAKSDIEGVRWIMTRRVILTLAFVVLMIVGSLKAAANAEEQAKRAASKPAMTSGGTQTDMGEGGRGFEGGGEVVIKEGDHAGYVSLG